MNSAAIAAALAERAEAVCRRYLPHGRRQGRYWVAGDLDGARGRSLNVRLHVPGTPGTFTDAATAQHDDLLDIIRHRTRAPTLREALDEARSFLALPAAPATGEPDSYDATEAARRLWRRCRAIDGTLAERYLHARGSRAAASRRCASTRRSATARGRRCNPAGAGRRRDWRRRRHPRRAAHLPRDPRSPARAGVAAPRKALGRIFGRAVRFGRPDGMLLVGEGIETVLSLVTAFPEITAAAALSAGSLGAFAPPPGLARLVIPRDNDIEG